MRTTGRSVLGLPSDPLQGYRGIDRSDVEARIVAVLQERGDLSLTELHKALYHNVAQDRLHGAIARLRDGDELALRQERRARTGRARVVGLLVNSRNRAHVC